MYASAVAAAVFDRRGYPAAVLAISLPTERMPISSHERLGLLVAEAATRLSS